MRGLPLKEAAAHLGMTVGQFRYATELARRTFIAEVHRRCEAERACGEEA